MSDIDTGAMARRTLNEIEQIVSQNRNDFSIVAEIAGLLERYRADVHLATQLQTPAGAPQPVAPGIGCLFCLHATGARGEARWLLAGVAVCDEHAEFVKEHNAPLAAMIKQFNLRAAAAQENAT